MTIWYLAQRVAAFLTLVAIAPLFGILWLAVRASSRGPFLYSQIRPGLHARPMRTWKIRTMRPGADSNPENARCVQHSNPEITSVGRVLRNLKLDELPQLWNIAIGQMAFVGPRPIAIPLYEELCLKIPGFRDRTSVHPGLSNIGQVSIEENASQDHIIDDWKERFEAEKHYLKFRSISYDLIVIFMTGLYISRKLLRTTGLMSTSGKCCMNHIQSHA